MGDAADFGRALRLQGGEGLAIDGCNGRTAGRIGGALAARLADLLAGAALGVVADRPRAEASRLDQLGGGVGIVE
ncbi:hypothetical protein D3C75_1122230 [compost metagenome]